MISIHKDFNKIPPALLSNQKDAWRDDSVLKELTSLYNGKCAYCETKTTDLQIDHYRPLDKYNWLANEWSNLLPVCKRCNQAKRNKFPIDAKRIEKAPEDKNEYRANSKTLLSEEPIILHPEIDDIERHIKNIDNLLYVRTYKGQETVNLFELNINSVLNKIKLKADIKKTSQINKKYENALLKSELNTFWKKYENKNIPIRRTKYITTFEILTDYIKYAPLFEGNKRHIVKRYFSNILDIMFYEVYFENRLKSKELDVFKYLINLKPITEEMKDVEKKEVIENMIDKYFKKENPVYANIYFLDRLKEIRVIYKSLKS